MSNNSKFHNRQLRDPNEYEKSNSCVIRDTAAFVPRILRIMGRKKYASTTTGDHHHQEEEEESPKKILDYGCGSGSVTWKYFVWHAQYTNSKIYGLDICPNMIAHAKEKFSHDRVEYFVGDILSDEDGDYPLKNDMFDAIISIYTLHWMKDYREALARLFKQLNPGGKIGIMIADKLQFNHLYKRLKHDEFWSTYSQEVFYPDYIDTGSSALESYLPFMESLGYKILKTGSYPRSNEYESFETPLKFLLALNPFMVYLEPEFKAKLRSWYTSDIYTWPMPATIPRPEGITPTEMEKLPVNFDCETVLITAEKPEEKIN